MAITYQGRSITFSATNEATPAGMDLIEVVGMMFRGTGLTADQQLLVKDRDGNILADYNIEGAADNADLWGGRKPQIANGISLANTTVAGTWTLTVIKGA